MLYKSNRRGSDFNSSSHRHISVSTTWSTEDQQPALATNPWLYVSCDVHHRPTVIYILLHRPLKAFFCFSARFLAIIKQINNRLFSSLVHSVGSQAAFVSFVFFFVKHTEGFFYLLIDVYKYTDVRETQGGNKRGRLSVSGTDRVTAAW